MRTPLEMYVALLMQSMVQIRARNVCFTTKLLLGVELPEVAWSCPELPGVAWSCLELPGVAWSQLPGPAWTCLYRVCIFVCVWH